MIFEPRAIGDHTQCLYMKHQLSKYVPTSTLISIWMINSAGDSCGCNLFSCAAKIVLFA